MDNKNVSTEGIILSQIKHKESSKILNVLTKDLGKIQIYAQGALKPKSELLLVSEQFSKSELSLTKSRNFYYIKHSSLINPHLGLRKDINKIMIGKYLLELADKTLAVDLGFEKIYDLLSTGLDYLERIDSKDILKFLITYEIKYISFLGYRPILNECSNCGSKDYERMYFNNGFGGLVCAQCVLGTDKFVKLSKEDIEILNKMLYTKFIDLNSIIIKDDSILYKLQSIISDYISYSTEILKFNNLEMYEKLMI
ncbi:MAG: DNA repair protein RecO [Tissierellia bacterium]|nr:DNA repair protein RecO [Tissierellia bacterium]